MSHEKIAALEAILFVSGDPLSTERIGGVLEIDLQETLVLLKELQGRLEASLGGIRLSEMAGGWQLVSAEEYEHYIERMGTTIQPKISTAMMETLAIISYRQPVTRQEMEKIRGVDCGWAVKQLQELELIEELGRKEVVGRPVLFGTTEKFLRTFGIKELEELPRWEEFQEEES